MFKNLRQRIDDIVGNGQVVSLFLVTAFILVFLLVIGGLITPFLITIVIFYLLDNLTDKLAGYELLSRYSRSLLASVVLVVALCVITLVLVLLIPFAMDQLTQLVNNIGHNLRDKQLEQFLSEIIAKIPFEVPATLSADIASAVESFFYDTAQVQEMLNSGVLFTLASAENLLVAVIYVVVIPIILFFLLHDKDKISAWFASMLPRNLELVKTVWLKLDAKLGDYVRGKFIEIIILTSMCLVGFSLMGLNYAVLMSTLVGLAAIVPILGLIAVTIPVVIIAWLQWGLGEWFWYLLMFYTLIQAFDGYVLIPLLFGEVIRLHPLAIIFGILFFGHWFGIWGVFFAIPLVILVQIILVLVPMQLRKNVNEGA